VRASASPMKSRKLTDTCRPRLRRGDVSIVIAAEAGIDPLATLAAVLATTATEVPVVLVADDRGPARSEKEPDDRPSADRVWLLTSGGAPLTSLVELATRLCAPADVVVVAAPAQPGPGWFERLRRAALSDTNRASASTLTDLAGPLAVARSGEGGTEVDAEPLRPRLSTIALPCAYLRRDAIELAGTLDTELALRWSLVDLAQRCLLAGLSHVAADDVIVPAGPPGEPEAAPTVLTERYPYLYARSDEPDENGGALYAAHDETAASAQLPRALTRARGPGGPLTVTLDARDLRSPLTGTRRHTLELAGALAASGEVRVRALVSRETSAEAVTALRALSSTEVLALEEIGAGTTRDAIFHRPQQMSHIGDLGIAMRLGERLVLGQLDLIAYRNPAYHAGVTAWHDYRRANRQALAVADRVLVLSEHTRTELAADDLAPGSRVRVVAPGLDHLLSAGDASARGGEAAAVLGDVPFLLCLGADYMHKNRLFALRLLGALREEQGWQGRLVLAGAHIPHGSSRELERGFLAARPQLTEAVVDLGPITEEQRLWLMGNARAVLYPTVYEGYGLVPLEAGRAGVPCIFAAQTSLAEVAPQAATLVPWDASASAAAARGLLEDGPERDAHVALLAELAARRSWGDTARDTLAAYREALISPVRESAMLVREAVRHDRELGERIAAHDTLVATLAGERDHSVREGGKAWAAYLDLKREVGIGLGLIGPKGALPEDAQRALLALSQQPLFRALVLTPTALAFRLLRSLRRRRDG
jgi:glycosyltransferase involved in cell wall biosynthesis